MKKIVTLLAVITLVAGCGNSERTAPQKSGKSLTAIPFRSSILKKEINYSIYLPPGYEDNQERYPIIYALHSFGANHKEYIDGILLHSLVDSLIKANLFPPCLIVTPDAGISWYINDYTDSIRYSDMFIQEFMPWIELNYHTLKDRSGRTIMGFSMGGAGALNFALLRPDLFGSSASFCAGFSTKDQIIADRDEDYITYHQELYGKGLLGVERVNQHFLNNNPLYLVESMTPAELGAVQWYISSADDDYHSVGNAELHLAFKRKNIPHEFRVSNGQHTYEFVNENLPDYLRFISPIFCAGIK